VANPNLNPATIQVGDTYNDLGATITGPTATDKNLGIKVSVDGRATTTPDQVPIDTTQLGTHTILYSATDILYSATDQNGLIGYAARTVNVVLPEPVLTTSPSIVPTPDATSTPSSAATSTTPATAATAATSTSSQTGQGSSRERHAQKPLLDRGRVQSALGASTLVGT
jgi:hypothetical protein